MSDDRLNNDINILGMAVALLYALVIASVFVGACALEDRPAQTTVPHVDTRQIERAPEIICRAEFWRGYSAGLEKCGPMLGIKK